MEDSKALQWSLVGATLFGASIFILCFIFIVVEPQIQFDDVVPQICADKSPEVSCYNANVDMCRMVYQNYFKYCQSDVKSKLGPNKVTSLIGPAVRKCTLRKYDKSLHSRRKSSEASDLCKDYFTSLDSPGN